MGYYEKVFNALMVSVYVTHYKEDITLHDKIHLENYGGEFLLGARPTGTDLMLKGDFIISNDAQKKALKLRMFYVERNKKWFHGIDGDLIEITKKQARSLLEDEFDLNSWVSNSKPWWMLENEGWMQLGGYAEKHHQEIKDLQHEAKMGSGTFNLSNVQVRQFEKGYRIAQLLRGIEGWYIRSATGLDSNYIMYIPGRAEKDRDKGFTKAYVWGVQWARRDIENRDFLVAHTYLSKNRKEVDDRYLPYDINKLIDNNK